MNRLHSVIALGITGHLMHNRLTPDDVHAFYDSVLDRCLDGLGLEGHPSLVPDGRVLDDLEPKESTKKPTAPS